MKLTQKFSQGDKLTSLPVVMQSAIRGRCDPPPPETPPISKVMPIVLKTVKLNWKVKFQSVLIEIEKGGNFLLLQCTDLSLEWAKCIFQQCITFHLCLNSCLFLQKKATSNKTNYSFNPLYSLIEILPLIGRSGNIMMAHVFSLSLSSAPFPPSAPLHPPLYRLLLTGDLFCSLCLSLLTPNPHSYEGLNRAESD